MITLKSKQEIIINYFLKGYSKRRISRETKIHRNIVTKYINEYSLNREKLIKKSKNEQIPELIDSIIETPKYNVSNRKKRKITDKILEIVKKCLKENETKKNNGQHKQMMKNIDIFELLKSENFDISYTTICNLIKNLKNKHKEAFIKQEYELGDICEFDWGEVKIFIAGKLVKLNMAIFTSAASNFRYARLFYKQDTQSFQQSHALFFEYINGVYKTLVYDNMRVAVRKFVGRTEKEPTEGLLKLSTYYKFDFRFCNVRKGNEKGHVERSVEYVRRKAFCIEDKFETLENANEHLLKKCEFLNKKKNPQTNKSSYDIFNLEQPNLISILNLPKFECSIPLNLKVDKYSTISIDTCRYSVPEEYVGKVIFIKKYPNEIICYNDKNEKIAFHYLKKGLFKWYIKLEHYLKTLKKKPGALPNSLAFNQLSKELKIIFQEYYKDNNKDFLELIDYIKKENKSINDIKDAIIKLKKLTLNQINTDKIKFILSNENLKEKEISSKFNTEIINNSKQQILDINNFLNTTNIIKGGE